MAEVTVGRVSVVMPKSSERTMTINFRTEDAAFGPHFILQKEVELLYVSLDERELRAMRDWCNVVLRHMRR